MKRKVISICLIFLLCLSFVSNAYAVNVSDLMDLTGKEYYYEYVKEMVEKGIVNGYPNGTFGGKNNITWAEALTMMLRGANITVSPIPNSVWYEGTRQWYIEKGLITGTEDMTAIIDRQNVVSILNKMYEVPQYVGNTVFSDTDDKDINSFYFAGIINGYSAPTEISLGIFGPKDNIIRGDFCIIESRIINNFALKEKILSSGTDDISDSNNIKFQSIRVFSKPEKLLNTNNIKEAMLWMVQNDISEYTFTFDCTKDEAETFKANFSIITTDAYHSALENYYCIFCDKSCSVNMKGQIIDSAATLDIIITLKDSPYSNGYSYKEKIDDFEKKFIDMILTMGVTNSMSVKEKSDCAFKYIDYILEYDTENLQVYNIENNCANCTGYTALYDYMLKRMGISSRAITGDTPNSGLSSFSTSHVWSGVLDENGNEYFCDVTWGDPVPDNGYGYSNTEWFWLTYDELMTKDYGRSVSQQ